jgi:type II secretory ATPase GspE/PulE/Tfp pilus assembly ATPase PilB-like protein
VCGPTGSGKTTTLYSALSHLNSIERNIITLEDPVEYDIPLIRQTQVNPRAGLTYGVGLRAILRQDPDVILVGETRDQETMEMAVRAALTGHLVFSTLHTNSAVASVPRLIDMGAEPYLLASTLTSSISQRLVRTICRYCKEEVKPDLKLAELLHLGEEDLEAQYFKGAGCKECKNTGYRGRLGIFEILVVSDEFRTMILEKADGTTLEQAARGMGMETMIQDGVKKAKAGMTTLEEVARVALS